MPSSPKSEIREALAQLLDATDAYDQSDRQQLERGSTMLTYGRHAELAAARARAAKVLEER